MKMKFVALQSFVTSDAGGAVVANKGDVIELNECSVKHLIDGGFIDFYVAKKAPVKKDKKTEE